MVASTYTDVFEGFGGNFSYRRCNGNCQLELSNAPHEFDKGTQNQALLFFMETLERIRI